MKRHRVRLRSKVRSRRLARLGAFLLAGGAALGAMTLLKPAISAPLRAKPLALPLPEAARVDSLAVRGVPDPLARMLETSLAFVPGQRWGPLKPARAAAALRESYACLREVRARRSWSRRSVAFEAVLREPVARTVRAGRRAGYIDKDGALFTDPAGLFDGADLPEVDIGAYGGALGQLSRFLAELARPGALPAPLARLRFTDASDGWSATLADGTALSWGDLEWTEQKLSRLREVLSDAASRFGGAAAADLRSFEDGRILVRPRG